MLHRSLCCHSEGVKVNNAASTLVHEGNTELIDEQFSVCKDFAIHIIGLFIRREVNFKGDLADPILRIQVLIAIPRT